MDKTTTQSPAPARNGGDLVVESLAALGATTAFGIPGQHALGLFDALSRSPITFVSSRVENNAAFAADGYARATGKPAVLFLSTGPGALTALAGLEEAYATGVPIVVVASQIPEEGLGGRRKGLLHQLDDQKESVRNVTKYQETVHKSSSIPYVLEDAWAHAITAPAGPVWVEIPQDVLLAPASVPAPEELFPQPRKLHPHPGSVKKAADMLAHAQRPAIICGGGVRRSANGPAALLRLAEALQAPVVCSPGGNSGFPVDHPLSLGNWIEDRFNTEVLEDADVVLAVGTAIGEVTSNYSTFTPRGQLIQVDAHPRVLESNHPGLGLRADASLALTALTNALPDTAPAGTAGPADTANAAGPANPAQQRMWHDQPVTEMVAATRKAVAERLASQDLATEQAVMAAIRDACDDSLQTFWDMTIAAYWAWNVWDAKSGQFHSAQGAGGLGYGFPAAFGAAVGTGQRVLAVAGDGSAMYSIAELATARQHDAPVTWLIIDDGGYGILREYMNDTFGKATATELSRPDFVALAQAFGVPATHVKVSSPADAPSLTAALTDALGSASGPNVVVVESVLKMWEPSHLS